MSRVKLMIPRDNTRCFSPGTVLAMASACATFINRSPGAPSARCKKLVVRLNQMHPSSVPRDRGNRARYTGIACWHRTTRIQLTGKDRHSDFACDQCIDCFGGVQIQELGRSVHGVCGCQDLENKCA